MSLPKVKIEVEPDKIIKAEVIASYRITIPKEIRRDLNIEVGDTVIVAIIGVEKGKNKKKSRRR
ncbi:AbrB/MazE/SpoVT family DNA-binding domain-containing protein [Thermococcus sp. SY098]|uniref:AbrB/MazE/SpoVT family DNA-binding domain-containing protein n=1 Tax=Thermococcus sp. SY098 TaxID=3111325 RepID=UPI002D7970BA|nr:AbrB/MazE/SpoVT family DNA-binding domain-containing protein [Thermococcus sp. SY098]WRS52242.1 AbrB/MazE/SpoVT family DNA-binding domain-containing protein [Thermococcus sp. SY098]